MGHPDGGEAAQEELLCEFSLRSRGNQTWSTGENSYLVQVQEQAWTDAWDTRTAATLLETKQLVEMRITVWNMKQLDAM